MFFSFTLRAPGARDLGFVVRKHPDRVHSFSLSFGVVHVFFPVANDSEATCAVHVEVDPIGLVRRPAQAFALAEYVNDRPYVGSSFLAVAIHRAFGSCLAGSCPERPELAEAELPLEVALKALPARHPSLLHELFEPLGYEVTLERRLLDDVHPTWGEARVFDVTLRATVRVRTMLAQLAVLIPALDEAKHYWVGEDEVEKLLRRGEGWLATHPKKAEIAASYLKKQRRLVSHALARLEEEAGPVAAADDEADREEAELARGTSLNAQRMAAVLATLEEHDVHTVVDAGCGEGRLVKKLLDEPRYTQVVGLEVSPAALERAEARLDVTRMRPEKKARLRLLAGSVLYRDRRLERLDALVMVEVIEHIELDRLVFFERNVFGSLRPRVVLVTTPNREANALYPSLPAGRLRHRDHRFEWTRAELAAYVAKVGATWGYDVEVRPIGDLHPELGAPTQLALFVRRDRAAETSP